MLHCGTGGTKLLPGHHGRCPGCANLSINVSDPSVPLESLTLDSWEGRFRKIWSTIREKISGQTKRRAREVLTYDRTDPAVTRKLHHVEETNEAGETKVMHHEEKTYPARRRPPGDHPLT